MSCDCNFQGCRVLYVPFRGLGFRSMSMCGSLGIQVYVFRKQGLGASGLNEEDLVRCLWVEEILHHFNIPKNPNLK